MSATNDSFRLCYVESGGWAWFANVAPAEVWGDDWNDAPHDCNAGRPYARGGQEFVKVAFDGDLERVGCGYFAGYLRDRYGWLSAEQINRGDAPWLVQIDYAAKPLGNALEIPAGVMLREFRSLVATAGGKVYEATA